MDPKKNEKPTWKKVVSKFGLVRTIFFNLIILIIFYVFIKGLFNNKPILKPFEVPKSYFEQGFTGDLMLTMTLNKYQEITEEVYKNESFVNLGQENLDLSQTMEKANAIGMNVNSIINVVRKEFGFERNEINIDITEETNNFRVYLKFPEKLQKRIIVKKDPSKTLGEKMEEIAEKIAFEFIIDQNPELLIRYLVRINYNLEDFETYVQKVLNLNQMDKAGLYLLWAKHIRVNGQPDKALRKINEAIEMDSTRADVWAALGDHYWDIGKFDKSFNFLTKALEIDPSNADSYSYIAQYYVFFYENYEKGLEYLDLNLQYSNAKDRGYYLKGIVFANMEKPDSIVKYIGLMNEASYSPEREADIWASYYGKVGDKDLLIKYAQRGVDYGLPIGNYLREPPYSFYLEDSDFLAFLDKNNIALPDS